MAGKRKRNVKESQETNKNQKTVSQICILHDPSEKESTFTPFSKVKGISTDSAKLANEKLHEIHQIREQRLSEPMESSYRLEHVCNLIPENLDNVELERIGYHRKCYQNFTKNLNRLQCNKEASSGVSSEDKHHSPRKRSSLDQLFPAECIFCGKQRKKNDDKLVKFPSFKGKDPPWKQIESQSLELEDMPLYRRVHGQDLWAREAQYHSSCYNSLKLRYVALNREKSFIMNPRSDTLHNRRAAAHASAFSHVLDYIQKQVVEQNEVVQLGFLRRLYIEKVEENGFPSPDYRGEKLKAHLEKDDIFNSIDFAKINPGDEGFVTYVLVYNSNLSVADAVTYAYKLGSKDKYQEVALLLHNIIEKAFKENQSLPWPPTADDLDIIPPLPDELVKFLNFVISGDARDIEKSEKLKRIVLSIGQDICRAVTKGEWKLPKHILLASTVRHLYRSKQLITILNRLGHCESYDFALELDTALAKALEEVSTLLTPQIVTGEDNEVFHMEWDNMNKITTNIHGTNVVNSTGGIMVQEIKPGVDPSSNQRVLPIYERTKSRSLKIDVPQTVPPFHLFNRVGPKFPSNAAFQRPNTYDQIYDECMNEYNTWFVARIVGSSAQKQLVPGFGGFVSATGNKPIRMSTIDYFTPINEPFTDYAVIKELLKRSEEATDAVGQHYVLNTFDLGGCMKALPILWKFPDKYKRHVVTPGPFHTTMNYIGMVTGHKCRGSGYTEILLEAKLATSGCLKSILSGKAYAKAFFALKTVTEALQRLLMEKFMEETNTEIGNPAALVNLVQDCNRDNLNIAIKDPSTQTLLEKYLKYEEMVRKGHLGKTAVFWLSVVDHTRLILMLQYSVKTNNLSLFHKCNGDMADLFFAYDGQNYSRYLVWLDVFLTNIDATHPGAKDLLRKGGIAIARSLLPGALSAVDKTMEETFMKFAKSSGGFGGIFHLFGAYERWCRTTSTRAQYFEKMLEMCGLVDDPECPRRGKHRELERAEILKSEDAVQRTLSAIRSFTNPFDVPDRSRLYSIASGAPVPPDVEEQVLGAEISGRNSKEAFIRDRFMNGSSEELFFEPIHRLKLKTMEACNKTVKLTASDGKVIQFREQSDLAFMLLVKSQLLNEPLDLEELMSYSLTAVPHCLGTPDGFFAKTNKAKMLHFLLEEYPGDVPYPKDAFHVEDGNALLHVLTNLAPTFGEICLQILDQMVGKKNFIFSTDSYHQDSVKAQERLRRGSSQRYIVGGPATRKPKDFKLFLANEDNKTQFFKLLLQVLQSKAAASRIEKCHTALFVNEGKVYKLSSSNGEVVVQEIEEIHSDQEETDTRIVLYLKYAATLGYSSAVVRTPDSDIFFILLHHALSINLTIYLDTGSGKHRQIINVSELANAKGQNYCTAVLGIYVYTGEDVTSAFKGKGKIGPLKKLQKNPRFYSAFRDLGNEWSVEQNSIASLEEFTCLMFGYPREKNVNAVRSLMLKKMVGEDTKLTLKSKVDFSKLPPCSDNLKPHIFRVNHRLASYKRADQPTFWKPKPHDNDQGWVKNGDYIEPVWSCGPILPSSLIDLVESTVESLEDEETEEESDEEMDFDEVFDEECG